MDYLALQFADIAATGAANTERFSVSMNFPKLELTDMDRTLESLVSGRTSLLNSHELSEYFFVGTASKRHAVRARFGRLGLS